VQPGLGAREQGANDGVAAISAKAVEQPHALADLPPGVPGTIQFALEENELAVGIEPVRQLPGIALDGRECVAPVADHLGAPLGLDASPQGPFALFEVA